MNPRHPHNCQVYHVVLNDNPFSDDEDKVILYNGKCRKYINHRTKMNENVIISEYMLSLPGTVKGIKAGDIVEVDDHSGHFKGMVIDCYPGTMGTNVYWNNDKN